MNYLPLVASQIPYRVHVGGDRGGGLHWHSEMELFICLQGSQQVVVENQAYQLHPSDALLLPGYAAHTASSSDKNNLRVAINFGYGLLKDRYAAIRNICLFLSAADSTVDPALRYSLQALETIFRKDGRVTEENEWQIRGNLFLLCHQLQAIAPAEPPSEELQNRIRMMDSIFSVLRYVEKHYAEKITVAEMATLAGYAKTYFCRQFKRITGLSFYRYLTEYRIHAACLMLDIPGQSIGDIAQSCGFATQTLFCRAFKECTGLTPSQYRQLPPTEKPPI